MDPFSAPSRAVIVNQKPSQLLISDYPQRAIAIVTSSYALVLRPNATPNEQGLQTSAKCLVDFSVVSKQDLADFHPLTPRPIYGTLGLISIGRDVFLCVVTQAVRVANVRPGETVERIGNVEFFCLNNPRYDDTMNPYAMEPSELSRRDPVLDHPCQELQKLLGDGSFYYSTDFDLTNRLQDRTVDAGEFDIENFDDAYLWNSFMIRPLLEFRSNLLEHEREALDTSRILTSAIRGFCQTLSIPQSSAPLRVADTGLPSALTVISRLSCRRAGTRFNARGIDDDGNVANCVETETIYWSPKGVLFSYAQVRGSVPVFWEQSAGLKPGTPKITITRLRDGTQPAFNTHFDDLEQNYGAVHVLNLLSPSKMSEGELIDMYAYCIEHCHLRHRGERQIEEDHALLRATYYDFHSETRGPEGYVAAQAIARHISDSVDGFAYYLAEPVDDDSQSNGQHGAQERLTVVLQQEGVFRTNCLDCLDRTNLIQTIVSQLAVKSFLIQKGDRAPQSFWAHHDTLWADNGDALSKIYAGTGALKSSFTRHGKMSLAGAIADMRKSAERLYINNFADKGRQQTIDTLLGRVIGQMQVTLLDPISDYAAHVLRQRQSEFSSKHSIGMLVGTFNLNGKTEGIKEDLSPWLCPRELGNRLPEIVAVGFQEIVELSPQQIMNSDPRRKQLWEDSVKHTLNSHTNRLKGDKYVLLRSGQLVGAALCIFVKASVLPLIKNVEGSVKKTGLSGMAGNKGAVAIRMDYAHTQLCFVTAHLAAGFANYEERNRDYATIHEGLHFQRNRKIENHDTVIWLGDFNYRIGLANEMAREMVKRGDIETLYSNDQLNLQMVAGNAFHHYSEARITFPPTYKFDIGTDAYDTSEKTRIPAWTDRILRKGTNLRQVCYSSAPLKFSDHRPVYATFECVVNIVDTGRRDRISRQVYDRRKAELGGDGLTVNNSGDMEDEDLIGYEAIEPGLPKASSDHQKWWLDNGKTAQSKVQPPGPHMILNSQRPSNPFGKTEESEWVPISRPTSYCSVASSQFEHIPSPNNSSGLSHSGGRTGPRKLPPTYEPATVAAKFGRLNMPDQVATPKPQKQEPPPPPPPRRQGTVTISPSPNLDPTPLRHAMQSQVSQVKGSNPQFSRPASSGSLSSNASRKPPPVAKKPAHLKQMSPASNLPAQAVKDLLSGLGEDTAKPLLSQRTFTSSSASTELSTRFDPSLNSIMQPPGLGLGSGTHRTKNRRENEQGVGDRVPPILPLTGAVELPGMSKGSPPVVPLSSKPKLAPALPRKSQQEIDLLGSLDNDTQGEMNGWETMRSN